MTLTQIGEMEEGLLRRGQVDFRVTVLHRAALSVGVAMRIDPSLIDRANDRGLPVVARATGGTAVLLAPGDLLWSIVLPRGDPRAGPSLTAAYAHLGEPLVALLSRHRVRAAWEPAIGLSRVWCLLGDRGRVLRCGDRIVSGAAQHLTRVALLHHGTLPRRVDRALHRALFPGSEPAILDRLVGTEELGIRTEPNALRDELAREIAQLLNQS